MRTYYDRRAPEYDDCCPNHLEHDRQEPVLPNGLRLQVYKPLRRLDP